MRLELLLHTRTTAIIVIPIVSFLMVFMFARNKNSQGIRDAIIKSHILLLLSWPFQPRYFRYLDGWTIFANSGNMDRRLLFSVSLLHETQRVRFPRKASLCRFEMR